MKNKGNFSVFIEIEAIKRKALKVERNQIMLVYEQCGFEGTVSLNFVIRIIN